MANAKYCVYNQTRESFLSLSVTAADTMPEGLRELMERLTVKADSGLWITPYRGFPSGNGLSPIDLVYLDGNHRVLQEVESYPTSNQDASQSDAASALALPAHTIYSSQTQPGDQLLICVAEEMEWRLKGLSNPAQTLPLLPEMAVIGAAKDRHESAQPVSAMSRAAAVQTIDQGRNGMNLSDPKNRKATGLKGWLQGWLSSDRRKARRQPLPGLVAYYWTGSAPKAYQIGDISSTGFYLLTEERWFPGTMVLMTLQRTDANGQNIDDSVAVQSRVVRWDKDGLGLAFVLSRALDPSSGESMQENGADRKTLDKFLERLQESEPQLRTAER